MSSPPTMRYPSLTVIQLETFLKKVAGVNDIEDALQRLDKLEQGELRTVIAQVASDSSTFKDGKSLLHSTPRLILNIFDQG